MTNQEAFDKMMKHLRSLSGQSLNRHGFCAYNGSMCAIGVLMTDEEQQDYGGYYEDVENLLREMEGADRDSMLRGLDLHLLVAMQSLHDSKINWSGVSFKSEDEAEAIAKDYGLIYTKP
jgi:hypothetical protein